MGRTLLSLLLLGFATTANADDALQWSGFALLRASNEVTTEPLATERLASQVQLGVDWFRTPAFGAHIHLIARNEESSRRGTFGVPEAYLELNLHPHRDRLRLRAGAMFLPSSRENVDALWENPYTISSSALNSWLGEEFRPIGIDATYTHRSFFGGATIFRGNDTFGALPAVRGWSIRDHWTLLGEWLPVDDEYFTSVSAETDHRLGWSARGGWNGAHVLVQLTHIDNRSDALEHGELDNWNTRFDIVSAEYTMNDWTIAAESGWGPTVVIFDQAYKSDISATYLLASKRLANGRASLRVERFSDGLKVRDAITGAYFWSPRGKFRLGGEVSASGGEHRAMVEIRYHFSPH